ncbi:MAG: hypothetical protein MUC28_03330 [Planctomycetes bacterium]|jgi:hypothetical protein|nr:hypothetical protein [Planctomycetota bacterium]
MDDDKKEKASLIKDWQRIINPKKTGGFFLTLGLAQAVEMVKRIYSLVDRKQASWGELSRDADIDEADLYLLVRSALFGTDVSIRQAKYVVVSVDKDDEYTTESIQSDKRKAEDIAALLRVCPFFYDVRVITMEKYLDILDPAEVPAIDEEEMAVSHSL